MNISGDQQSTNNPVFRTTGRITKTKGENATNVRLKKRYVWYGRFYLKLKKDRRHTQTRNNLLDIDQAARSVHAAQRE